MEKIIWMNFYKKFILGGILSSGLIKQLAEPTTI